MFHCILFHLEGIYINIDYNYVIFQLNKYRILLFSHVVNSLTYENNMLSIKYKYYLSLAYFFSF